MGLVVVAWIGADGDVARRNGMGPGDLVVAVGAYAQSNAGLRNGGQVGVGQVFLGPGCTP